MSIRWENYRDLLPPLKRGASPFREGDQADPGVAAQDPPGGFPLQGREFGPVQPYGLIGAQAKPFAQGHEGGVPVPVSGPPAEATHLPLREGKALPSPAGEALLGGGLKPRHGTRSRESPPIPEAWV